VELTVEVCPVLLRISMKLMQQKNYQDFQYVRCGIPFQPAQKNAVNDMWRSIQRPKH